MQFKIPFVLILIGFLTDLFGLLYGIWVVWILMRLQPKGYNFFAKFFSGGILTINDLSIEHALVPVFWGLLISIILVFFVIKSAKNPTKKTYTVIIIMGILSLITWHIGGILEIMGSIIGINKLKNPA